MLIEYLYCEIPLKKVFWDFETQDICRFYYFFWQHGHRKLMAHIGSTWLWLPFLFFNPAWVVGSTWYSFWYLCRGCKELRQNQKGKTLHNTVWLEKMISITVSGNQMFCYLLPDGRRVKMVCGIIHNTGGFADAASGVNVLLSHKIQVPC